ncbi:AMP-binding protein [Jeotgalibacillus soli]|uniref:AMP-dependent synthetase/ligase domain-containing protein n=1 Tax=Jeotgalibacillus soli TaxID=889306 RepID=A0A0C2VZY8_9BACL|nr:AMP-binding protein [Jeotgalibacillus soli]KIL49936.1 hypothetical protein KP78_14040 [Jeotgalibacillus soli]
MRFWNFTGRAGQAVVMPDQSYTYMDLEEAVEQRKWKFNENNKQLVLILCKNNYDVLVTYLAALQSSQAVMLLSVEMDRKLLKGIIDTYKPKWIYGSINMGEYESAGEALWIRSVPVSANIHPDLAVLLSTSGTTGSRKFVRLSYDNIQSNAESIVEYLHLDAVERGVLNLPISYSYGLSIINSHLAAGATVLLTDESIMAKSFWPFFQEQKATSFAGVPFTYQMLQRIGFFKMNLPHLRSYTQAGGRLDERLVKMFGEYAADHDKRFYVMYGQTEASPRMSYIPPDRLLEKTGSIGVPIPGGSFEIDRETEELIYKGSNVMMGYAECLEDLRKGDELHGVLHTGDTAMVDEDGFYTITGRIKRFVKLFGLRVNLDEVEKRLESELQAAVACTGTDDWLIVAVESEEAKRVVQSCLDSVYKLHKSAFRIHVMESIPRTSNGKTDYAAIKDGFK